MSRDRLPLPVFGSMNLAIGRGQLGQLFPTVNLPCPQVTIGLLAMILIWNKGHAQLDMSTLLFRIR